jgi:hypothetical protein
VLLVLGTFLVVFMGGLGIYLGQLIAQSGTPGSGTRFTGGPNDVAIIMAVFGLVIAFGIATMVGGIWQIKYGKPNRKLMVVMFLVAGILLIIAWAIKATG